MEELYFENWEILHAKLDKLQGKAPFLKRATVNVIYVRKESHKNNFMILTFLECYFC